MKLQPDGSAVPERLAKLAIASDENPITAYHLEKVELLDEMIVDNPSFDGGLLQKASEKSS